MDLKEVARRFLVPFLKKDRENLKMLEEARRATPDGETYELDFLIIDEELDEEIGVNCKDWKRSIAVNVVNSFIKEITKLGLSFGIMIAKKFSGPARSREQDCDSLVLINEEQMINWLKSHDETAPS